MLAQVVSPIYTVLFLFLIWDFTLFLVLLGLFSNKSGFWRSQEIQYHSLVRVLVEAEAGQDIGS